LIEEIILSSNSEIVRMAIFQLFLLSVFACSGTLSQSSSETQIQAPLGPLAAAYHFVSAIYSVYHRPQINWAVTLYEHGRYKGQHVNISGDSQLCVTLSNEKFCDFRGDRLECIEAAKSVSAVKFNLGSCVKAYRDLHCFGLATYLFNDTESCSFNLDGKACFNVNDVFGSFSSCEYGECKYINWPANVLKEYLNTLDFGKTENITCWLNNEANWEARAIEGVGVPNDPILFFGRDIEDRYSNEEIRYLQEFQRLALNGTYILSYNIDPSGKLSELDRSVVLEEAARVITVYETFAHRHIELRAYDPLPDQALLRNGNLVLIEYKYIGAVKVQTHIFTFLTASAMNRGACTRSNFSFGVRSFEDRMNELEFLPGLDERGHLVASCLNGPAQTWNLAPQVRKLNRGDGTGQNWRVVENRIKEWLNASKCNWVDWDLTIEYRRNSRRPHKFKLTADYFAEVNNVVHLRKTDVLVCNNNPLNLFCELETF
jgi:DNA/RNA non-specific endonuclease